MLHKTLIIFAAAVAFGCVPVATTAAAAGHPAGHAGIGHAAGGRGMTARGGHAVGVVRSGHPAGFARGGRVARYGRGYGRGPIYNGPIYDSCAGYGDGYGYNGCPGYGVPIVGRVIDDVLGGYGPY